MPLKPIRYPLDRTGTSPDNLVQNERRTLKPARNRVFNTQNGAFFTESFTLRDLTTGQTLQKGVQYKFDNFHRIASQDLKQEVASLIVVVDESVGSEVAYDYQVVGGYYSYSVNAIVKQIEDLKLDNRPVEWGNILNKPEVFPPAPHLHDAGDVYGLEYVVNLLEMIRQAILVGDEGSHTLIYQYIDQLFQELKASVESVVTTVDTHVNADNPHGLTLEKMGIQDHLKGIRDDIVALDSAFKLHANNKNNPHETTPTKLGVYTKTEVNNLLKTIQDDLTAIRRHFTDYSNPHRTTAAQVDAFTKAETNVLVNAVRNALTAYQNRRDNPNVVTAGQTGAYTKAETTTEATRVFNSLATKAIEDVIKNRLTNAAYVLKEETLPISTAAYNQLRWNKDGLYYGTEPPPETKNLYVDVVNGVNETVTRSNGRGTREKPLKTIAFAVDQGPPNVSRAIFIMESQVHKVGFDLRDFNASAKSEAEMNRTGVDYGRIKCRGGEIFIRPYGPKTDLIPNPVGNHKYVLDQVFQLNTIIEFCHLYPYLKSAANPALGFYLTRSSFVGDQPGKSGFNFSAITFRRYNPSDLLRAKFQPDTVTYDSGWCVNSVQGVDLNFNLENCQTDTTYKDRTRVLAGSEGPFWAGSAHKSTYSYNFSAAPPGDYFINKLYNNKALYNTKGVTSAYFDSSMSQADNQDMILNWFVQPEYDSHDWINLTSNIAPPNVESDGFVVRAGKLFAKVKVGDTFREVQIAPPLYGDTLPANLLT